MQTYLSELENALKVLANQKRAEEQKRYLKDQFDFYGIAAPDRKLAYKIFLSKEVLLPK
jgi:hypothetical protein